MAHPSADRPAGGVGLAYRGVGYDCGSNFATGQGPISRSAWSTSQMEAEISLIRDELNANSVTVYGTDLDRLRDTATAAVERGLHVWLDPRLPDRSPEEILDHIAAAATIAESLRTTGADIGLTVGATHTILTPGILAGNSYLERVARIYFDGDMRFGVRVGKPLTPQIVAALAESTPRLNEFLGRAASAARGAFHGKLAYLATPWEQVDWAPFDAIGLVYYFTPSYLTPEQHIAELARYRRWNKPVLIAGFGTASYQGAEKKGFFSWDVVDRSGPAPTVMDGCVRDEGAQADYYRTMLGVFERAGVRGVAPVDLIHPTHPHSADPRQDLDMASMCIVKTIRENFADPSSPYRREKKESFLAIADHYARSGAREAVPG